MTAKVASPASPAEDLACRGPLKAKRLLYTEDQLSFTRKVFAKPPQSKGILLFVPLSCGCVSTSAPCFFHLSFASCLRVTFAQ